MTSTSPKSQLQVVLGAMTFGEPGKGQTRVFELEDVNKIIDVFEEHGHTEVDTARLYGQGTSEEYLGKIGWQKRGLVMGGSAARHMVATLSENPCTADLSST